MHISPDNNEIDFVAIARAGKNSIGVAILLLLGACNTIIGHSWAAWAILLISKSGVIVLQYCQLLKSPIDIIALGGSFMPVSAKI